MTTKQPARPYETHSRGGALIVEFEGEVGTDVPSASELMKHASELQSELAVVDLTRAQTINSKGLEWLEQVSTSLEPSGVKVRVVSQKGSKVWRILKLMRFDRFLLILSSVFEAVTFGRRKRRARK